MYDSADESSASAQQWYFGTALAEYGLLAATPLVSIFLDEPKQQSFTYLGLLILLVGVTTARFLMNFDEKWYRSRALAESIKTTCWRFMMRAEPFEDAANIDVPEAAFTSFLEQILTENRELGSRLESRTETKGQITHRMRELRRLSLDQRRSFYLSNRIIEQQKWYSRKSKYNKHQKFVWFFAVLLCYSAIFFAIGGGLVSLSNNWDVISVFVVIGTSLLGWIKSKRFGELQSSYNLTAHEIGIIQSRSDHVRSESDFSDFVNQAELAFSREHTQWTARRD